MVSLTALFLLVTCAFGAFGHGLEACPRGATLKLIISKNSKKCECVDYRGRVAFNKGCKAVPAFSHHEWQCDATCLTPTYKPVTKHTKREQLLLLDGTPVVCPLDTVACPIYSPSPASMLNLDDVECVQVEEDFENCGGCVSTGAGVSCVDIPGVKGTSCVQGKCEIYSCQRGFEFSKDTKTCHKNVPRHAEPA